MVVALPTDVLDRFRDVEREHGIPVLEQVQEAAFVWSHLTPRERDEMKFVAMQVVTRRHRT